MLSIVPNVDRNKHDVKSLADKYYRHEELVGKEVYDAKAKKIGSVSSVGYSKDGKTAVVVGNETIPFENISEIGDIIILKVEQKTALEPSREKKAVETANEKLCPNCNRKNEKTAQFCVKCGVRFA